MSRPSALSRLVLVLGALASMACSSSSASDEHDATGGSATAAPTNSAVLVAGQEVTPDDYFTYVGVFPEVPEGTVDFAKFREFGNANAFVYDGRVFLEQDGVMQRFDVNEALELVDGPRFSWVDFGIGTANATSTVFISSTRAYTFAPQLGVIVVWNPDSMERTDVIEYEYPARPADMETWASDGYVVGDKVIWNVFSGNFDTITAYPAITLVVADAHSNAPPKFVEDSRCLPGGPSFVDEHGDYYVHGAGYFGYFYAYGEVPPSTSTCVLRVNAGETEFDPSYQLDYAEATGSPMNSPWINVTGDQYFTRAWEPNVPLPEDPDEFWIGAGLQSVLVDQSAGTSRPYPELDGIIPVDGVTRIVDGVSYYQKANQLEEVGGQADIVELYADGIRQKFHLNGLLQVLERVR